MSHNGEPEAANFRPCRIGVHVSEGHGVMTTAPNIVPASPSRKPGARALRRWRWWPHWHDQAMAGVGDAPGRGGRGGKSCLPNSGGPGPTEAHAWFPTTRLTQARCSLTPPKPRTSSTARPTCRRSEKETPPSGRGQPGTKAGAPPAAPPPHGGPSPWQTQSRASKRRGPTARWLA